MFRCLRSSKALLSSPLRTSMPVSSRLTAASRFSPAFSRGYASKKSDMPKFRYFFLIMGLGTLGFLASLNLVGDKRSKGEMTEEEYEKMKARAVKRAFTDKEAFVVFVLGGPGSGKGTQCARIVRDYDFAHLSAGDLLRAEQNRPDSEFGDLIKSYIKAGKIVPQEITLKLLKNAMKAENEKGITHFLIDGFPRKMDQALTFEETIVPSKFALFFECPEQIMLDRLLNRGKTSGRADDNIESIRKRFATFVNESMPVVEYFENAGKVARLQCNQPVDDVYKKVQDALRSHKVEPKQ